MQSLQALFDHDCETLEQKYGCTITTKAQYRGFWRILDGIYYVLRGFKKSDFMRRATTIGGVIALRETVQLYAVNIEDYVTLKHEAVHIQQEAKFGLGDAWAGAWLFLLLYLFVPLPALVSWFRFKFEREAMLAEIRTAKKLGYEPDVEFYVKALSGVSYLWAWPEKKVRAWFKAALATP
jgi:hypothetical protein